MATSSMNLTTLRQRARLLLGDPDGARWSAEELEAAARQALGRYAQVRPLRRIATLTLEAPGREIPLDAVAGLQAVERVWWAYSAASPLDPPHWREFELWPGPLLFIRCGAVPQAGDVVRIWYTALHTLAGLDGATETTIEAEDEPLLALGTAACAAAARALALAERLNVDGTSAPQVRAEAARLEAQFRLGLAEAARRLAAPASGLAPAARLDRWEEERWQ